MVTRTNSKNATITTKPAIYFDAKQQVEMENAESDKALEELKKAADDDNVYKYAGSILIKSDKKSLIDELEEKKELAKTKSTVLAKQEERLKTSLQEQEQK